MMVGEKQTTLRLVKEKRFKKMKSKVGASFLNVVVCAVTPSTVCFEFVKKSYIFYNRGVPKITILILEKNI